MHTIKENPLVIERVKRLIDGEIYVRANELTETIIKRDDEVREAFYEAIHEANTQKMSAAAEEMLNTFINSSYYERAVDYDPCPEWQVDLISQLDDLIDNKSDDLDELDSLLMDCPKDVQDLLSWHLSGIKAEVEYFQPLYYLVVSKWLAEKLKAYGEVTFEMLGVHIWSVTDGSRLEDQWSLNRLASDLIA